MTHTISIKRRIFLLTACGSRAGRAALSIAH